MDATTSPESDFGEAHAGGGGLAFLEAGRDEGTSLGVVEPGWFELSPPQAKSKPQLPTHSPRRLIKARLLKLNWFTNGSLAKPRGRIKIEVLRIEVLRRANSGRCFLLGKLIKRLAKLRAAIR